MLFLLGTVSGCDRAISATGVVVDETGAPIADAAITMREKTVKTDATGKFEMFEIVAGWSEKWEFEVTISKEGFATTKHKASNLKPDARVVLRKLIPKGNGP